MDLSFRISTLFQSVVRCNFVFIRLHRTCCRQTCARTLPGAQLRKLCLRRASTNSRSSNLSSYLSRCLLNQTLLPQSFLELQVVKLELVPSQAFNKPSSASSKLAQTQRRQTRARTLPGTQQPKFRFRETCTNSTSSNSSTYPSRHSTNQVPLPRSLHRLSVVKPELVPSQVPSNPRRQTRARAFPGTQQTKLRLREACPNSTSSDPSSYPSRYAATQVSLPQNLHKLTVVKLEHVPFQALQPTKLRFREACPNPTSSDPSLHFPKCSNNRAQIPLSSYKLETVRLERVPSQALQTPEHRFRGARTNSKSSNLSSYPSGSSTNQVPLPQNLLNLSVWCPTSVKHPSTNQGTSHTQSRPVTGTLKQTS